MIGHPIQPESPDECPAPYQSSPDALPGRVRLLQEIKVHGSELFVLSR